MLVFYSLAGASWYKKEGGSSEQCDKVISKGQIISEQIYGVLDFPNSYRIIVRISVLATKMCQIIKIKAHYHAS